MNRSELVAALAAKLRLRRRVAEEVVAALFGTDHGEGLIADALDRGERVLISGFGTFCVRQLGARRLRDPRNGGLRPVPPRRTALLRPGRGLRRRLN